jgi:hypothetical protein
MKTIYQDNQDLLCQNVSEHRIRFKAKRLTCSLRLVLPFRVRLLALPLHYCQTPGESIQALALDRWATQEYLVVHSDDTALRLYRQLWCRRTSIQSGY